MLAFLQINVATQRGFVPVDEQMRVIDSNGKLVCSVFTLSTYFFACSSSTINGMEF